MFKQVKLGVLGEDQVDSETVDKLFQSWLHWEFVRHVSSYVVHVGSVDMAYSVVLAERDGISYVSVHSVF
jgi:hypothetical protein